MWEKELARDAVALGGYPFYTIVFIRAIIGQYFPFMFHLTVAFIAFLLLYKVMEGSNDHLALGFILLMFVSFFYKDLLFSSFAFLLYIGMIVSAVHLGTTRQEVAGGILIGIFSAAIAGLSYYTLFGIEEVSLQYVLGLLGF